VHRGEIWTYRPALPRPGQSLLRLILSADDFNDNDSYQVVIGAQVVARDPGLLSVRLGGERWLSLVTVEPVLRSRLDEHVATATAEEMDRVRFAMGALLDLG
jgi:mRNA-degrading endonuclease toxin of MazEF toxin-antitoxin module